MVNLFLEVRIQSMEDAINLVSKINEHKGWHVSKAEMYGDHATPYYRRPTYTSYRTYSNVEEDEDE